MEVSCRKQSVSQLLMHSHQSRAWIRDIPRKCWKIHPKLYEELLLRDTDYFGNHKQKALKCNKFLKGQQKIPMAFQTQ